MGATWQYCVLAFMSCAFMIAAVLQLIRIRLYDKRPRSDHARHRKIMWCHVVMGLCWMIGVLTIGHLLFDIFSGTRSKEDDMAGNVANIAILPGFNYAFLSFLGVFIYWDDVDRSSQSLQRTTCQHNGPVTSPSHEKE